MTSHIEKARECLAQTKGIHLTEEERIQRAIELTDYMLSAAYDVQTHAEKSVQAQIARMMKDPQGKACTIAITDQCFRSNNPKRIADQIAYTLDTYGVPSYLSFDKRWALRLFKWVGNRFADTLVPMAKSMVRRETTRVILPGEHDALIHHLAQRRAEGVRVNLNHLGEAILGEAEAERRLQVYLNDLAQPEIEYISVKISTICSQINLLAWEQTLAIITGRLQRLYRAAAAHSYTRPDGTAVPKFVNLDMEEYRDLHLTVEAFQRVLDQPEFLKYRAGIVLQSYLPDSYPIQKELTEWALKRVANGGAPIKIRIVKGANLAMEKVEASMRDWAQAPYLAKGEVDANFKRMVTYGCEPTHAAVVNLGVGSHNLFDIAYAMLLRNENNLEQFVHFEMLEGMADHIRRVVQELTGDMLLYCPVASAEEFQNAIAYLIRRLDENTAPENFLRHLFDLRPGTAEWESQTNAFALSCRAMHNISSKPRRTQNRFLDPIQEPSCENFINEADTDWSLAQNRHWAETLMTQWATKQHDPVPVVIGGQHVHEPLSGVGEDPSNPGNLLYNYVQATPEQAEQALAAAKKAQNEWGRTPVQERSNLLGAVAQGLKRHRGDLIGAMIADTGKTIPEADVEVSEAIDFAEYYRHNVEELYSLEDIQWHPKGTVLVAPPWNFPCSIPAGGILAALAAGNCVIFKPAPEAILVAWELAKVFWESGISKEVLQFLPCEDDPVGSMLVRDPRVDAVVLTGATSTAKMMLKMRPGIDLIAETGGKNAMIITGMCDRDLAVKDLVQSAFGHAGQKCSACSIAICEAEVYDDPHFREQLRDAAASLCVGSQWNPETRVNPLIRPPAAALLRGLTQLEEGEEWLLQPKKKENPNLWSPGIKLGVRPGSFTQQTELFGPVLGIVRADNLAHAIEIANSTPYGLTAGLQSLDDREQHNWFMHIEAGNCYINRGITGAIVQRQPFGGCKASGFGRGAKAGGPNYVMQLMHPEQVALPPIGVEESHWDKALHHLTTFLESSSMHGGAQLDVWRASIGSYVLFWDCYFSQEHDPTRVLGQDNFLSYVPHGNLTLRIQKGDDLLDVLRAIAAAHICGAPLEVSGDPEVLRHLDISDAIRYTPAEKMVSETEDQLMARLQEGSIHRIRLLAHPSAQLQRAIAEAGINCTIAPVIENGRVELLNYLREVSLSVDYHRYGNLGTREGEQEQEQKSCGPACACS